MKKSLAIWHYHHRTQYQNIEFFADKGFEAVSMLGRDFVKIVSDANSGIELAETLKKKSVILSVHFCLPNTHSEEDVMCFKNGIDSIKKWQEQYGLISVLSFDVPQAVRDNITQYVDYAVSEVKNTKIALEDFGLNLNEYNQISHLKSNKNFGALVDIGHMNIRICGNNTQGVTLFTNSPDECNRNENPTYEDYLKAIKHVKFPIFEIHLHNNDGINDMHYFLKDGTMDIKAVLKAIKDVEFDGILTIESAPNFKFRCTDDEADFGIMEDFRYLSENL